MQVKDNYKLALLLCCNLLICFYGCSRNKEKTSLPIRYEIKLLTDSIRYFEYGQQANPSFTRAKTYVNAGKEYFIAPDRNNHTLEFFKTQGGESIKSINLRRNGPSGIKQISNFQYHNNKLYVVDAFSYALVILKDDGTALKRIKLIDDDKAFTILPRYFTDSELKIIDEKAYFIGDADLSLTSKSDRNRFKTLIEVDLNSGKINYHFRLPELIRENQWIINQYFFYATNINDSTWVYSYDPSDSLYIYKLGKDLPKGIYARSAFHKNLKKWGKTDLNSQEAYKYYLQNTAYTKVIYDPYRRLIYRFVKHPNQRGIDENDLDKMWVRSFSLMVFDESYNLLAERLFDNKDQKERVLEVPVIDKDGLWMAYTDSTVAENEELRKYVKVKIEKTNN